MKRAVPLVALAAVGVGAVVAAPLALRHVGFFRVRQVEVVGLRYLAPERVVDAVNLGADRNVFDALGELEARAESVPGVVRVRATRRLPGTLRLAVLEREPVAFAPDSAGLIVLDAAGERLPYDAATTGFDLPLLERPDSALTRVLAMVRAADSTLYQEVSWARSGPGASVVLELTGRTVWLPRDVGPERLRALEVVRRHLAASGRAYAALDARFHGWIVVRRGRA